MDKKVTSKNSKSKNSSKGKTNSKGKSSVKKDTESVKRVEAVENKEEVRDKRKTYMIFIGIIIATFAAFIFINEGEQNILKSEFKVGEVGYLDDISLTLTDISYIHNNTGIEVSFEITNGRDNTITIIPDDYFVFYDINMVQIPNKFTNNKNIIKKDETVTYKLQYDVTKKELYEIYFYSQVAENNVKFSFVSSDIKQDDLLENSTLDDNLDETNVYE